MELCRGLLSLVQEKVASDASKLLYDDVLFCHLVEEVLQFEKELRSNHSYPAELPGVLHLLLEDAVLQKWLTMEKKSEFLRTIWSLLLQMRPRFSWSHLLCCYFNIKWAKLRFCLNELHLLHHSNQWKVTALLTPSIRVAHHINGSVTEEVTFLHHSPLWHRELFGQYAKQILLWCC